MKTLKLLITFSSILFLMLTQTACVLSKDVQTHSNSNIEDTDNQHKNNDKSELEGRVHDRLKKESNRSDVVKNTSPEGESSIGKDGKKSDYDITSGKSNIRFLPGNASGIIDKDGIRKTIGKNLKYLEDCYDELLQRNSDISGLVELGWEIHTDGHVENTKIVSSQIKDQKMLDCLTTQVNSWNFPDPPKGVLVKIAKYPISFVDKDGIRKTVRKNLKYLEDCYDELLQRNSDISGRVELAWEIHADGHVENAKIVSSQIKDQKMLDCLTTQVNSWNFPDPPKGVLVEIAKYPIFFGFTITKKAEKNIK